MSKHLRLLIALSFFVCKLHAQNQGINNYWILGYNGWYGQFPFGNPMIDFFTGQPVLSHAYLDMEFNHTHTNISDEQGNLLFYTNGVYIADATHDTMMNGEGINPSTYTSYFSDGLGIPQANLIIRKPGSNHLFYLIHSTLNQYPGYTCSADLYCSIIDINMNNGKGAVTQKNQILLTDSMNGGKVVACKHANGRDWWLMCHRINSNTFFKFLVTPYNISGPYLQTIGFSDRKFGAGQAYFSSDGNRYAHFWIHSQTGNGILEIFDFDRCSGDLSNAIIINIPYLNGTQVGLSFSPNSNVLYVSNVTRIYQLDLTSSNIASSLDTIAIYDGFLDTISAWPDFSTLFSNATLASDGKIYIATGNGTHYFHTIDNPDVLGAGCNVNQHSFLLPAYYFNTLPNHPNYFLGKIAGSPCDTVLDTGHPHPPSPEGGVGVFPNPSNGVFTLSFPVHSTAGEAEVYDVNGKLVHREYVAAWSQFKRVELSGLPRALPRGIYMCRMRWGTEERSVKVILQE